MLRVDNVFTNWLNVSKILNHLYILFFDEEPIASNAACIRYIEGIEESFTEGMWHNHGLTWWQIEMAA